MRTAVTGIPEQVTLPDGTVAYKDVGGVVFATVLDNNGTPADANDDVFISQSVESLSGPDPELDSGFTLLSCGDRRPDLAPPRWGTTSTGARHHGPGSGRGFTEGGWR